MNARDWVIVCLGFIWSVSCVTGCDAGPEAALQGQNNVRLTFFGVAVDQDGRPMPGVRFDIVIDAIPKDWSFQRRGRPHDQKTVRVTSGRDGHFALEAEAHILFITPHPPAGYAHLFSRWSDDGNLGFMITSWGEQQYKSDPERPAIFVFVRDGVKEISALPSRGGYQTHGSQWVANRPAWPNRPSLPDVVYRPPATQPWWEAGVPAEELRKPLNIQMTFYGLAVDQDGRPMPGVEFTYELQAYPRDWSFATRLQENTRTRLKAVSGPDGRFELEVDGCFLEVRGVKVPAGYRHFFEHAAEKSDSPKGGWPGATQYRLMLRDQQQYKSDPDRPAVFVFVKDGVTKVSALPSRGGYQASGDQWIPNEPAWPKRPSLRDVE
jgi:hypothetical protein